MRRAEGKRVSPAEFRRLWFDQSLRVEDIAAQLGITRQAVTCRARVRGLPSRRTLRVYPVLINDPEFADMYLAGVGARELAAHYGCHRLLIPKTAARLGLPPRSRGWMPLITMADYRQQRLAKRMAAVAKAESAAARRMVWAA